MDMPNAQPSVSERRGQRLAPLNTNFSLPTSPSPIPAPRPQRPRPTDLQSNSGSLEPEPLQPASVKRQSSKTGLRGFFGRDKSARKSVVYDSGLAHIEEMQPPPVTRQGSALDTPLSPSTCATPKTVVSTPTFAPSPSASYLTKPPPPPRAETGETNSGGEANWKPPPLFQAYPQAIKHDCLAAPALSAESILRIHASSRGHHKNRGSQTGNAESGDRAAKKKKDEKKKHLRSLSETIGKTEWTQKVYVLATSGYLLQYAGEGKHDRLPEKMLRLGPKTVAFASDAIPGKHWVLQVSHSDDNTSAAADTHRPFLSRIGLHRPQNRRLAKGFLLVFNSPEALSTWLLAVRAEIEARGGKKYVSEKVYDDGEYAQLRTKPSVRQMVQRDPNRFSNVYLQPEDGDMLHGLSPQSRRSSYHSFNRRSVITSESRSGSTSTGRTDGVPGTNITEPSLTSSNNGLSFSENIIGSPPILPDAAAQAVSPDDTPRSQTQSPPMSDPKQRLSMLMYPKAPTSSGDASALPRAQSSSANPLIRSASPPAPNFSVPSFSRRFAAKTGSSQPSQSPPQVSSIRRDNYEAIAAFPSPPQSPTRGVSSFDRKESIESMGQTTRKPLRISTSDASLGSLAESASHPERNSQVFARNPRRVVSPPQHPSIATGIVDSYEQQPRHVPSNSRELPYRQNQPRSRISVLHQDHPPGPNRRKSMPGLAGPPSAPPPNCPLPKIPSPVTSTQPPWPAPSTSQSPQLRNTQDRRISMAGARSVSSRAVFQEM